MGKQDPKDKTASYRNSWPPEHCFISLHTHASTHGCPHTCACTRALPHTCARVHSYPLSRQSVLIACPVTQSPVTQLNPQMLPPPTCFGHLVHRHTQLLRHVAQHREDSEASQDTGDGIAQSNNECVSAGRVQTQARVSRPQPQPKRASWATVLLSLAPGTGKLAGTDL